MLRKILILSVISLLLFSGTVQSQDNILNYAASSEVVGLSPILTNDQVTSDVLSQVYDTLFVRNPETNEIEPNLAVDYEAIDDETWEIKLREGVEFHDGSPFNAEAVKFTLERIADPEVGSPRASLVDPIESIEVEDEYTVIIKTKYPYGPFLATLTHGNSAIVSPKAVEEHGDLMQNAAGTGPFMVDEWVSGDHISLKRNENYWGEMGNLDGITYKIVPEASTRLAMLESGEIDFLDQIPPEHFDRLKNNPDIDIKIQEGTPIRYFGFNFEKEKFNNDLVRKAVAHAIDQEAIVSTLNNLGYKSHGILGPRVFGYKEEIEQSGFEYDLDKARELLAEAGYPDGFSTTIWSNSSDSHYKRIPEIIQAELEKIGIDAEIKMQEWGSYLSATQEGEQDMFLLGWSNLTADGSEMFYPNLHSDSIGGANRSFYDGADEYIDPTRTTVDQEERLELLHEANEFLVEEAVMIPLFHQNIVVATRNNVSGLHVQPNGEWEVKDVVLE
ncbi:MAG: glutathione ABC transporter substrate-binding protein [Halanaerobiales bacterium]